VTAQDYTSKHVPTENETARKGFVEVTCDQFEKIIERLEDTLRDGLTLDGLGSDRGQSAPQIDRYHDLPRVGNVKPHALKAYVMRWDKWERGVARYYVRKELA